MNNDSKQGKGLTVVAIILSLTIIFITMFNWDGNYNPPIHHKNYGEITIVTFNYKSGVKDTFNVAGILTLTKDNRLFINGTLLADSINRYKRIK